VNCFLNKLINAFSQTAGNSARSVAWNASAECFFRQLDGYIVEDSTNAVVGRNRDQQPAYILLAESPHTSEVSEKYPMAGDTGKEVSRVLGEMIGVADTNKLPALGYLLSKTCLDPCWTRFGIMNVSRLPLQKEAYTKNGYAGESECFRILIDTFRTLRNDMSVKPKSRRDPRTCQVQKAILSDLQARLDGLSKKISEENPETSFYIVPCGQVADDAMDQICIPSGLTRRDAVPHPARNQWRNAQNLSSWLDELSASRS